MDVTALTAPVTPTARRRPSRRRASLLAAAAAVVTIAGTVLAAAPADAAGTGRLNPSLATYTAVTGTDCGVTTSMWMNDAKYPGAGAYVTCRTNHTVYLQVETDWAPSGGSWNLWGRSGWVYAGYGTTSSTVYQTWTVLGGSRWWRGDAHVWIDGVDRGWAFSTPGVWTAGT